MGNPTRTCADCVSDISDRHGNATRCQPCNRLKRIKSVPRSTCSECDGSMDGKRADAEYCSLRCSGAAGYRRRQKPKIPRRIDRTCADCGKGISERGGKAIICADCGRERERKAALVPAQAERSCETCGERFVPKRIDATCCSRICTRIKIHRTNYVPIRYALRPCPGCGDEFVPKRSDTRCCSPRCHAKLHYSHVLIWHDKICDLCGKSFRSKRSDARRCSQRCNKEFHYLANVGAIRASVAAWRIANPDRCKVNSARYKARRRGWEGDGPGVSVTDWVRTLNRFDHRCAYCGELPELLHMDHVVPLSRGGQHAIGNVLPACPGCNLSKNAKFLAEWRKGVMPSGRRT